MELRFESQSLPTGVERGFFEFVLDAQKLIVFGYTVRAARSTGLNLAHVHSDSQISNGAVFGLTRTV